VLSLVVGPARGGPFGVSVRSTLLGSMGGCDSVEAPSNRLSVRSAHRGSFLPAFSAGGDINDCGTLLDRKSPQPMGGDRQPST